jgi:hypothetical protein
MATGPSAQAGNPELLEQLYRGGELLGQGKVVEAKDYLERAYQLDPNNEKAQNLLGLSYFKLGLFDRASEIYETLVRDNPTDPTLRVNLGLVYLKSNAVARAVREFEVATDLQPEHQKAHNYLGLALAQAGELGRAREHFLLAGSEAMAEKMARALEESQARAPAPEPMRIASAQAMQVSGIESVSVGVERTEAGAPVDPLGAQDWGAQLPGSEEAGEAYDLGAAPPPMEEVAVEEVAVEEVAFVEGPADFGMEAEAAPADAPRVEEISVDEVPFDEVPVAPLQPAPAPEPEPELRFAEDEGPAAPVPEERGGQPEVSEAQADDAAAAELPEPILLTPSARKRPPSALAPVVRFPEGTKTFESGPEGLRVSVREEIRIRTEGLVSTWGELSFTPEVKHHHGRPTEQPFGTGPRRLSRVRGQGALHFEKAAHHFVTVELREESVYLREDALFGLGEGISYENGKLPAGETSLELVSATGEGQVLLRLPGELRAVEVTAERPVRVPISAWVGWSGGVLARAVELGAEGRPAIEMTGEGYALISVAVG